MSASQLSWFSGDKPLFLLVLGLICAMAYKFFGKKEDPSKELEEDRLGPLGPFLLCVLIGSVVMLALVTTTFFVFMRH